MSDKWTKLKTFLLREMTEEGISDELQKGYEHILGRMIQLDHNESYEKVKIEGKS